MPQISAVMGSASPAAYLPALSGVIFMVDGTSFMGLGGPNLVKGATGQTVDAESLGGARMHTEVSAVAHYLAANDTECLAKIREYVGRLPRHEGVQHRLRKTKAPARQPADLYDILPHDHRMSYDMMAVLSCLWMAARWSSSSLVSRPRLSAATAHRGASCRGPHQWAGDHQRQSRRAAEVRRYHLHRERREGRLLHRDGEPRAAAVALRPGCERVHGRSRSGAVRDHSGRCAIRRSDGHRGGAPNRAHHQSCLRCRVLRDGGQGFDPDFILSWPTGRMAVMEGESAVEAVHGPELTKARAAKGAPPPEVQASVEAMRADYEHQLDAKYAGARGYVDAIITADETRDQLAFLLRVTSNYAGPHLGPFVLDPLDLALPR